MSLSSALNTALSGMRISSRQAETVARNVSSAGQDGYVRRSIDVQPISPYAPGVTGVTVRNVDTAALADRRAAQGEEAGADVAADFWASVDARLGDPDDPGSLSARIVAFESALVDATAQPGSAQRLQAVTDRAQSVARALNDASREVGDRRQGAERAIETTVAQLNRDLQDVQRLNVEISRASNVTSATDLATLQDQRAAVLDRIGEAVAIRVLPRDFGAVAVVSEGGEILVDSEAVEIGFTPATQVAPQSAVDGGGLNRLEIRGRAVGDPPTPQHMGGGRLEALFAVRDRDAVDAQAQLDAMASELIRRFAGPDADPTLVPGEAGLFVDGDPFAPGQGVANRLGVAPALTEAGGSQHWRLRDGFGAAAVERTAAPVGNLAAMLSVMSDRTPPTAANQAALGPSARDLTGLAADLKSMVSASRGRSGEALERAQARTFAARERDAVASGVDMDEEMRRLVEIEQNYAAAARVIQAVDEMMDRLSRI